LCKTAERLPIYRRAYRDGIDIRRLSDKKVNLILRQRENYTCNNSEVLALEYFLSANNIEVKKLDRCEINWNRYSILDEDGGIERSLKKLGIECGNYNWPTPLHLIYDNDGNVVFKEGCKMSEYVSGHILNIPIWSSFFRRIYNDVDIQTKV
jgi:hypothetical protein